MGCMKEPKDTLQTVIFNCVGALFFVYAACSRIQSHANTAVLALLFYFAITWSLRAILSIVQYLRQRKQAWMY